MAKEAEEESHHHSDSISYSTIMSRDEIEEECEQLQQDCVALLNERKGEIIQFAQRALFKHLTKWFDDHVETSRDILKRLNRHHKLDHNDVRLNKHKQKSCVVVKIFKRHIEEKAQR